MLDINRQTRLCCKIIKQTHVTWLGLSETSATVMFALKSPSASSHAAAAQEAEADSLAATSEAQGAMLSGATFPNCRYIDWLTPVSVLLDSQEVARVGRSTKRGSVLGVEGPTPGRVEAAASVAQST